MTERGTTAARGAALLTTLALLVALFAVPMTAAAAPGASVAPGRVAPPVAQSQHGRAASSDLPTTRVSERKLPGRTVRRLQTRMLRLVNVARAVPRRCGTELLPAVGPLRVNPRISLAARRYAQKMARRDWFGHTAPDGTDPGERVRRAGYRWSTWGENLAAGFDTIARVVTAWLASPEHCRSLMSRFQHVGFGYGYQRGSTYGHYWVQDFATPA